MIFSDRVDALNLVVLSPVVMAWISPCHKMEKRINLPLSSKDDHFSFIFPRLFAAFRHVPLHPVLYHYTTKYKFDMIVVFLIIFNIKLSFFFSISAFCSFSLRRLPA